MPSEAHIKVATGWRSFRTGLTDTATSTSGLPLVTPGWSEDVRQAWGINVHYKFNTGVHQYKDDLTAQVVALNPGWIRDRLIAAGSSNASQMSHFPQLAAAGIKQHVSMSLGALNRVPQFATTADFASMVARVKEINAAGGAIASFGGMNEPNVGRTRAEWAPLLKIEMQRLKAARDGDPAVAGFPVCGPSMKDNVADLEADFAALAAQGGTSGLVTHGDFHKYPGGVSPSNGMDQRITWGEGAFGVGKPGYITEGGYNYSIKTDQGNPITETVGGIYGPRHLMEAVIRDRRLFTFELMDDGDAYDATSQATINATQVWESHFGIIAVGNGANSGLSDTALETPDKWRRTATYTAMQRFMALVADPGSTFTPTQVRLDVDFLTDDLHWKVYQRRNGQVLLILWRDVDVYNPNTRANITVPPVNVTVTLETARALAVHDPAASGTAQSTAASATTHTVAVAGNLKVLVLG